MVPRSTTNTRDYTDVVGAPLLRCYDAASSEVAGRYHLLLDDVTTTHVEATGRPPTAEYAAALADGLAALHARWWGGDTLAARGCPVHDPNHVQSFVEIAAPACATCSRTAPPDGPLTGRI